MSNDPSRRTLLAQVEVQNQNDPHDPLVRQVARLRARDACEYCLHPTTGQFEIDHIIPAALWSNYIAGLLDASLFNVTFHSTMSLRENLAVLGQFVLKHGASTDQFPVPEGRYGADTRRE